MWELGRVEAKSCDAAVAEVLTCHDVTLHPEKTQVSVLSASLSSVKLQINELMKN